MSINHIRGVSEWKALPERLKEPRDGPTDVTLPNVLSSLFAVSYVTFSTCAASLSELTAMRPYFSKPWR